VSGVCVEVLRAVGRSLSVSGLVAKPQYWGSAPAPVRVGLWACGRRGCCGAPEAPRCALDVPGWWREGWAVERRGLEAGTPRSGPGGRRPEGTRWAGVPSWFLSRLITWPCVQGLLSLPGSPVPKSSLLSHIWPVPRCSQVRVRGLQLRLGCVSCVDGRGEAASGCGCGAAWWRALGGPWGAAVSCGGGAVWGAVRAGPLGGPGGAFAGGVRSSGLCEARCLGRSLCVCQGAGRACRSGADLGRQGSSAGADVATDW
jgi:hypothetical protein